MLILDTSEEVGVWFANLLVSERKGRVEAIIKQGPVSFFCHSLSIDRCLIGYFPLSFIPFVSYINSIGLLLTRQVQGIFDYLPACQ